MTGSFSTRQAKAVSPFSHRDAGVDRPLVVLTFDDGFQNFHTDAFPVLRANNFTATVFLPTAFIGNERRQFCPAGGVRSTSGRASKPSVSADCLTWSEVRELHKAGIEFGSHTVNHPKLFGQPWSLVESELRSSKLDIEDRIGQPINSFCYPYAFPQADQSFCRSFKRILAEVGYTCATTTGIGRVQPSDDPSRLKRLPASSVDTPALLGAKLDGDYDWLAFPQAIFKAALVQSLLRR